MNNSKYNLDQSIKTQIEEREITPSRDLWAEIETQIQNNPAKKAKGKWLLIAASLALVFSLSTVFFLNKEEELKPEIAEIAKPKETSKAKPTFRFEQMPLIKEETQIVLTPNRNTIPAKENRSSKEEIYLSKEEIPLIKENPLIPEVYKNEPFANIANLDSAKVPLRKKKYVDASTLLFSVEHKEVINTTKDGSNVASIDLNTQ